MIIRYLNKIRLDSYFESGLYHFAQSKVKEAGKKLLYVVSNKQERMGETMKTVIIFPLIMSVANNVELSNMLS